LQENPKKFFDSMGGLHDSRVEDIVFNVQEFILKIKIDDLFSNFMDFPEYLDSFKNIDLVFYIKDRFDININLFTNDNLAIYAIEVEENQLKILFSPDGYIKFDFKKIMLIE